MPVQMFTFAGLVSIQFLGAGAVSQKSFFQYVKRYGCIWSHQSVSSRAAISTEEPSFWAIQSLIRHDTHMRVYQYVQGNAVEYKC